MSKTLEVINERAIINLAKRLVKTESMSGNERKIATLLAIEMKKAGFNKVQFDEQTNDIIGVMPGLGKGKTLVLVGYIDTAPPGLMEEPFEGLEMDGSKLGTKGKVIYGRGACDMKGGLAAMISTGAALKRARARLKGNFAIVGLANTKTGKSSSLKQLLEKFQLSPDYLVACPPTNLDINLAHPGQATFEIQTYGRMSNLGNPTKGENAILKMNKVLDCILSNIKLPEDKDFGKANMVISSIASKPIEQFHSVPNVCYALMVRQIFEKEDPEEIRKDLLNILKKNNYKIDEEVKVFLNRYYKPHSVKDDIEIISLIQEARKIAGGKPSKLGQWTSGINVSEIFDIDFPIVGFGPGDEQYAHTPNEHVLINQVIEATKVYSVLAEKICVQMKDKSA